jgi:Na+/H+ antiporter NhaD/arsenite permease-like protein
MTGDMFLVFALLLATIVLFISDRLRMDVVAIMLIVALMLTGLLTPGEALSGFGDPLVILIAALFVVGEGLFRTGVAFSVGNWLVNVAGTSETRLLVLLMLVVAVLSAFMSNTGAVAIFIPVALNLAMRAGIPATRLLLPMAYAGSIGGMLTLIGTPPNLVVSTELSRVGLEPFQFFSFLPIGLLILLVAIRGQCSCPGPAVPGRPGGCLRDRGQVPYAADRQRLAVGRQDRRPGPAAHSIRGHRYGAGARRWPQARHGARGYWYRIPGR